MVDSSFRFSMNVSTGTGHLPINHYAYRCVLPNKDLSVFVSTSSIAGNDKISALERHKPRTAIKTYCDIPSIRPLNIGNIGGISNPTTTKAYSNLSPEKLIERSKELRLGRISTLQNPRLSLLSTTYQQSLMWPGYNSRTGPTKQSQVNLSTVSPTALRPAMNKSPSLSMPNLHQPSSRAPTIGQSLTEQKNILVPIDSQHKSLPKIKSPIPKADRRTISKTKCSLTSSNTQSLQMSHNHYFKQLDNNNNNNNKVIHSYENIPLMVDKEYAQKATAKCAYWLKNYVPGDKFDENDV